MAAPSEKRIDALQQKKAQIEAELSRLQARSRAESRKADTRRKVLIGAIVMQEMEAHPDETGMWMRRLLAERLTRDRDRLLFGLETLTPLPDALPRLTAG